MKNEKGQSTVEFIFAFAFGVSVILLVFNSAMNYITGYLTHYATYMASRTYLTQDSFLGIYQAEISMSTAEPRAREIFNAYKLEIFGVNPTNLKFNRPNPGNLAGYYQVGAYVKFDKTIDMVGKVMGQKKLNLTSESFLGKEPTRNVCAMRVCKAITNAETCQQTLDITLFDDGC